MMMKDKYFSKLGKSVQEHLIKLGLEKPREFNLDNDNKITIITKPYRQILDALG
ncbi:GTP cyclohydrolase I FolE, partial [Francisella tularensis subsp. holarctica]|nr:GTP cyclohydrolase I FolE [Francisella tularensis subsp. holarctica]